MDKLIITCAISGAEVTKAQHDKIPYTIDEVISESIKAYEAGASVIHLHVRFDDGTPTQDKKRYDDTIKAIKRHIPMLLFSHQLVVLSVCLEMKDCNRLNLISKWQH